MALGKQGQMQSRLFVNMEALPRSAGHVFYDHLQRILRKNGFDAFAEGLCAPFYAERQGRPSIPPGRYFRMHLVGYFEGIDSERGIVWRCADSLSLREFLQLDVDQTVPDQSSLSRIRSRLPLEVHNEVFQWVIAVISKAGLVKGKRIGVDSSTMEANAAMRSIVRKDTGENYTQMLERMGKESGMATPTRADLARMDKKRKDKTLSNEDWQSTTDTDARIARMKDKTTHMAYKPEHAVDLDTGAILAAPVHHADRVDTKTVEATLDAAASTLENLDQKPSPESPAEVVADKGYFAKKIIKNLNQTHWTTRISEPDRKDWYSWQGDHAARKEVYANRTRIKSGVGKAALRKRSELVERSFQHVLDRGGQRRTHLRGLANVQKGYILAVAGFNLGLLLRSLLGFGTPKGLAEGFLLMIFAVDGQLHLLICVLYLPNEEYLLKSWQAVAVAVVRW